MSGQGRRPKIDLDYLKFHTHGIRVPKNRDSPLMENTPINETMDLTGKFISETQIDEDITDTLLLYTLDDLDSERYISEGVSKITDLGKNYRYIHVELKNLMGETAYAEKYVDYAQRCETIRKYVQQARKKN